MGKVAAGVGCARSMGEEGSRKKVKEGGGEKKNGGKDKKGERERKRLRWRVSRRRPRSDDHARRSGVTRGTRKNRETGRRLDSDVGTGFLGDWEIGRGTISDGLSSTMKRDLKIFLARDLFW